MIRNGIICERRAWHDAHTSDDRRVIVRGLAERLWLGGLADEEAILSDLVGKVEDLRGTEDANRERATAAALDGGADHILGARLRHGDLLGEPTILTRVDGRWCAGVIRSGAPDDGLDRPRWPIALELEFEAHVLRLTVRGDGSRAFVIGPDRAWQWYDMDCEPGDGHASIAAVLANRIRRARQIVEGTAITRGEVAERCRMCPWREVCKTEMIDDLTRVHGIDRQLRRDLEPGVSTLAELARHDPGEQGAAGVSRGEFLMFRDRARLLLDPSIGAFARGPLPVPGNGRELFLHAETDSTRGDLVFSHALLVRMGEDLEEIASWVAADGSEEGRMFEQVLARLHDEVAGGTRVYLTTPHVRDAWHGLARRHPSIGTTEDVSLLLAPGKTFDISTDIIAPLTEWPISSRDVASVARHLGLLVWDGGALAAWDASQRCDHDPVLKHVTATCEAACRVAALVLDALVALPVRQATMDDELQSSPPVEFVSAEAGRQARRDVYSRPTLRPCSAIPPEKYDFGSTQGSMADLYGALADELPLGGAEAMRPDADGGIHLIERLRASLPWMEDALALIERQLRVALWAGRPWLQFRPICLVGAPGVGKSHLARELSRLAKLGHAALDLGAMHDAGALAAVSRGWTTAKPCWPAQMMATHGCANPILTLDEIEKAGGGRRNGDPLTAILGMLEPGTASSYFDTGLMTEVDLSAVCWISTANDASRIPRALASRLDIVEVGAPEPQHFDGIVADLLAGMARRWGVPAENMPELSAHARGVLRRAFARYRSVRMLGRQLGDLVSALVAGPRSGLH
jgi:predicted RecB family nuclease